MIKLNIEPGIVKSLEKYLKENPPFSIALDGYVNHPTIFIENGPYANFDHHHGVDRLSTRSTVSQVYSAIKLGLLDRFRSQNEISVNLDVNDCDEDVCASLWQFYNHDRIEGIKSEPLITRFVSVTDLLDTSFGVYPISLSTKIRKELAWIYEPYTEAKLNGMLIGMNDKNMHIIIESVLDRITRYTINKGEQIEPDTRYEKLGGGDDWIMIKEIGAAARSKLLQSGFKAFVSVREKDGKFSYSIGKLLPFIDFPLIILYKRFNQIEGLDEINGNCWGGNAFGGGSPRKFGSDLTPKDLEKIMNGVLEEYKVFKLKTL